MRDNRVQGQSQLDYLWVNFGPYSISKTFEENSIPTSKSVKDIVDTLQTDAVHSIKTVGKELICSNINGEVLSRINISDLINQGKTVIEFGRKYITDESVEYPSGTPVYFIKFSDGTELLTEIDQYSGKNTDSISVNVDDNQIQANLKINNENSLIPILETEKGIKADLKVSNEDSSVKLSKELEGLKAKIVLDNEGRILKFKLLSLREYLDLANPDKTTVYFIKDRRYFYFGSNLIGDGTTDFDSYYTKDEVDNKFATKDQLNDISKLEVVDNLNSTDSTKALAASQGKVLADKLEELKTSFSSVYRYKGSVQNFESLPENSIIGDTYNVIEQNGDIPAGTNYAWNGTDWDALGGSVNLSEYSTTEQVNQLIDVKVELLKGELNIDKSEIDTIKSKLTILEGDENTEGSIKNAVQSATNYVDTQLESYVLREENSSLISNEKLQLIDDNANEIIQLKSTVETNTEAINTNTDTLELLNSDENTEGSILNKINTQILSTFSWSTIN